MINADDENTKPLRDIAQILNHYTQLLELIRQRLSQEPNAEPITHLLGIAPSTYYKKRDGTHGLSWVEVEKLLYYYNLDPTPHADMMHLLESISDLISRSPYRPQFIMDALGMTSGKYYTRRSNPRLWTLGEIEKLIPLLAPFQYPDKKNPNSDPTE